MVIESWRTKFSLLEMFLALSNFLGAITMFLLIIGSMTIIDQMNNFFQATPNIFLGRLNAFGHRLWG